MNENKLSFSTPLPLAESLALFKQAKAESLEYQYQFAIDQGATFHTTPDAKSFYLQWYPKGVSAESKPPMIVTLHGSAGWVFAEFYHFQAHAQKHGYGIIALQWWFGGDGGNSDYYLPSELYPILSDVLKDKEIQANTVLLHGFSRASANIYAVTAFDRYTGNDFFGLIVANSGKASSNFPPNMQIGAGNFGMTPFDGTHWVMVCGMDDPNPDRDGCVGMNDTKEWVTQYGGVVDLLIEDEDGDHIAFYTNPENISVTVELFSELLNSL